MSDKAITALKLWDIWNAMPTDRGGKNGPNGQAFAAFLKAKEEALTAPETFVPVASDSPTMQSIKEFIYEDFGFDYSKIKDDSSFIDDIGIDEIDICEMMMWVEETFTVAITDEEEDAIETVKDLETLILKKLSRS